MIESSFEFRSGTTDPFVPYRSSAGLNRHSGDLIFDDETINLMSHRPRRLVRLKTKKKEDER